MKKGISYFLLILFCLQLGGFYIEYKALQMKVRKEMKQKIKRGISEDELTFFDLKTISSSRDFKWEKENKEFWYQGKIYDIVSSNGTSIKCIDDIKEKSLFEQLDSQIKNYFSTTEKGKNALQALKSILQFQYILKEIKFTFLSFFKPFQCNWYSQNEDQLSLVAMDITTPPPNGLI